MKTTFALVGYFSADYDIQNCGGETSSADADIGGSLERCRERCMGEAPTMTGTYGPDKKCICAEVSSDEPLKNLCIISAGSSP